MKRTSQVLEEFLPKAKALYDFEGETNDEISFKVIKMKSTAAVLLAVP